MGPELLDPEGLGLKESRPTKESDCYALGMVIYEVLSGQKPYASCKNFVVIRKVLDGERPGRPQGDKGKLFTDGIWEVVELCWKAQPVERISAEAILRGLEGKFSPSMPPPPNVREEVTYADDSSDATPSNPSTFHFFSSGVSG